MLARRASANCRCGRPTTESSSFFFVYSSCGVVLGLVRGRLVRCPDAVSFFAAAAMRRDEAAKRNTAPIEEGGTLCFYRYCVLGGWVGDMRTASCRTPSSACWAILYTLRLPTPAWKRPVSAQRLLRVSWILLMEDTARSGGMEIPTNLAPTGFGSGSGRGP